MLPGIQVYVLAPLPVNVAELPLQIVEEDAVAPTTGIAFTLILILAVALHPFADVPVTV